MEKNFGGTAFPLTGTEYDEHSTPIDTFVEPGMFLRDYFAAKAMQALLSRETKLNPDLAVYAGAAYDVADAMLEARDK